MNKDHHKAKIIYLHGFNSSGDTGTASYLKSMYPDSFLAPDYDYINPDNAATMLDSIVMATMKEHDVIMVGKSLGGFWANYFAEKYRLKCILINPGLQPHLSLLKYVGTNRNFNNDVLTELKEDDVAGYLKYQQPDNAALYKHILLGEQDTVTDPAYCKSVMRSHLISIFPDLDHYFNNYGAIADAVRKAIQA